MRFLVLATPRVGSTLMVEALYPHCHHEIWHPKRRAAAPEHYPDPYREPFEYLDAWCRDHGKAGAKVMLDALPMESWHKLLPRVNRILHIRRLNVTEQMVSFALAKHTGRFDWRDGPGDPEGTEPIEIELSSMVALAERWVEMHDGVSTIPGCHNARTRKLHEFWYENLELDEFNRARRALGYHPLDSVNTKLRVQRSPERYRRLVKNMDEINRVMGPRFGVLFPRVRELLG